MKEKDDRIAALEHALIHETACAAGRAIGGHEGFLVQTMIEEIREKGSGMPVLVFG
jgi:hypothetical protein